MARLASALQYIFPLLLGSLVGYASLHVLQTVRAEGGPPTISLVQPSDGSTVAGLVALWASASAGGFAGVRFQVNGTDLGSEITSGSCSLSWDTSGMADGSYSLSTLARTESGLLAASPPVIVTVANAAPVIFDVKAWNINDSSASITWYTMQAADGLVAFGVTPFYGQQTPVVADASIIHTRVLTGLASGTTYHFRTRSRNAVGRLGSSADQTFTTTGQPPPGQNAASLVWANLTGFAAQTRNQVIAAIAPPVRISNPAAAVTATTAIITWTTDQPADSQVQYDRGRFRGNPTPALPALVKNHSVRIGNLAPGTTYLYQVQSRNAQGRLTASATLKFTTLSQ